MTLRCLLDGLLLPAEISSADRQLVAFDGDEAFAMEALEAKFYELVTATWDEVISLERARYRLLRFAEDFQFLSA